MEFEDLILRESSKAFVIAMGFSGTIYPIMKSSDSETALMNIPKAIFSGLGFWIGSELLVSTKPGRYLGLGFLLSMGAITVYDVLSGGSPKGEVLSGGSAKGEVLSGGSAKGEVLSGGSSQNSE